jgi:hypothetical protein
LTTISRSVAEASVTIRLIESGTDTSTAKMKVASATVSVVSTLRRRLRGRFRATSLNTYIAGSIP